VTTAHNTSRIAQLRKHIETLAGKIGTRNVVDVAQLAETAIYIESSFSASGLAVIHQNYQAEQYDVRNLITEIPGSSCPQEIVVVGAHYDTAPDSPGANDNGSGIASLLVLAELFANRSHPRTIRFVAFTCEEDPFFQTEFMGSYQYANSCRKRGEDVRAMLSLETIGYYEQTAGSQHNPWPLSHVLPSTANFLLFASNLRSRKLLSVAHDAFRAAETRIPCKKLSLPGFLRGINASDQWSFWKHGYDAIMITDTANLRSNIFHSPDDTWEKVCYGELASVVTGIEAVITRLASK
jgi:Zn-dependent M28 family amino/carboxypeptidase